MAFTKEADFEDALVNILSQSYGWEKTVLTNCTEEQLIQNWADILFENNRCRDRLNECPLTRGEMQQIIEQINLLKTPLKLNGFINGRSVTIARDNQDDKEHFGKEVSLKIYDRHEIAAGQSRYQIVRQPRFSTKSKMLNDRRGDIMLLINGMPVIHIELKKSGVPVSQACNQIEKYMGEGVYNGIFSLVQIFVAMNPEETVYFANPGPDGRFDPKYYFHWADFNNEPINDWKDIASSLLSIPMAHQLIGFYTIPDETEGFLKVMRSYQYYAANAISDKVAKNDWEKENQRGGYIWHTTGSGKTMTSFKAAQLIASSKMANKVIFLVDRIELGTQSLGEYRGFAGDSEDVQETENTGALVAKLKSNDPSNTLIVTSIQKMSNIKDEDEGGLKTADIEKMNAKRIVFIVDECHRSTFGEMLLTIKHTFPRAIFFGFTGTPILKENEIMANTTADVFGDELHRYSIADGIRDKNVLGFDPYKVLTYKDADLRKAVALEKSKSSTEAEAIEDDKKREIFYKFLDLPMAGHKDENGDYINGIEDYIPNSQYKREEHQDMVVKDIVNNWNVLSRGGKFHAIFATSSIPEAIQYYRRIKKAAPDLKISALFDPSIDNTGGAKVREDGLVEIIQDYNARFDQVFTIPTFQGMKKDISERLAHKKTYERVELTPEKELDLLIVVNQMLTGFDSKWVNTLYLDKVIEYENIIQAFSRTNRLFGPEKPFGTIKYYRRPHTMEKHIEDAVKLYSGDRPFGLFAERLDKNIENMNAVFAQIKSLFEAEGIENFSKLPAGTGERKKFARLFKDFNEYLEAAKIQGFRWSVSDYKFAAEGTDEEYVITIGLDETTYKVLALRYKELFSGDGGDGGEDSLPYEIDGYLTTIDTTDIDANYMNSRFDKYLKELRQLGENGEAVRRAEEELHKTFATLTREDQKFAELFLHDIQSGSVAPSEGKTFRDYIAEYANKAKGDQIQAVVTALGVDEAKLRKMMALKVTEANINEFGRFDELKNTADRQKARKYFEMLEGKPVIPPRVPQKIDALLRKFILSGGFGIGKQQ